MIVFFTWLGVALIVFGIYIFLLWKKNRKRSRFQAKLTVIFLLFVLVPTVPLTFFIANLFTQSADLLMMPGIGDALNQSIETIRTQVEERGRTFFNHHPDPGRWSAEQLRQEEIASADVFRISNNRVLPEITLINPSMHTVPHQSVTLESLHDVLAQNQFSAIFSIDEAQWMTVYHIYPDASVGMATYAVPFHIMEAEEKITQALRIYGTLTYIKESIIQKDIIWGVAVLLIFGVAFLSILVAKKISQGISEPIQNLVRGIHEISENNLEYRVRTNARDEFKLLVDSFNNMVQDLDTSRKKLIKAERMAAWQQVARQISHEMKNSLTPISLSLRRLYNYFKDTSIPSNVSDSLKDVEDELHALQTMAAEFSEFARLPQPDKGSQDMNKTIRSVIRLLEPSLGQVKIITDLAPTLPLIEADQEQIRRVLNNLIKNSIEASHDRGSITVRTRTAESEGSKIQVEILDTGEGMDDETLGRIFDAYFTTKRKGTGLGLAIVQKIIEDHNGEISVESTKGKGTRIRIIL